MPAGGTLGNKNALGGNGSPPSKYTKPRLVKARSYVRDLPDDEVVHSIQGLAGAMKVCTDTMENWERDPEKTEIIGILKEIRRLQCSELLNKGLSGDYNPTIAKLMLTKHGYRDAVDSTLSGPGGKPVEVRSMELAINEVDVESTD